MSTTLTKNLYRGLVVTHPTAYRGTTTKLRKPRVSTHHHFDRAKAKPAKLLVMATGLLKAVPMARELRTQSDTPPPKAPRSAKANHRTSHAYVGFATGKGTCVLTAMVTKLSKPLWHTPLFASHYRMRT